MEQLDSQPIHGRGRLSKKVEKKKENIYTGRMKGRQSDREKVAQTRQAAARIRLSPISPLRSPSPLFASPPPNRSQTLEKNTIRTKKP